MNKYCTNIIVVTIFSVFSMFLFTGKASAEDSRQIVKEVVVTASSERIWANWTTKEGLGTIFRSQQGPLEGRVELRPQGPLELYFVADNPVDMRGTEGSQFLAFEPAKMLSFTWRNPPVTPALRPYFTHVMLTFEEIGPRETRVRLVQNGFGTGADWDSVYRYFDKAWSTVLHLLMVNYAGKLKIVD